VEQVCQAAVRVVFSLVITIDVDSTAQHSTCRREIDEAIESRLDQKMGGVHAAAADRSVEMLYRSTYLCRTRE
jgi:hypothetical protein